jgi:hypothetical protein
MGVPATRFWVFVFRLKGPDLMQGSGGSFAKSKLEMDLLLFIRELRWRREHHKYVGRCMGFADG